MDTSIYSDMVELEYKHWWFIGRREILSSEISRLGIDNNANILDVGCGPGANLIMLANFGKVTGIDSHLETLNHAKKKGFPTIHCALPEIPPLKEYFDLICAFDMVEHIKHDQLAISNLVSLLKPRGKILITVPINPWMWSEHDVYHHHFRRYTPSSIRSLVMKSGLIIQRQTCFNSFLFPIIAMKRLLNVLTKARGAMDHKIPHPFLNNIFKHIFRLEKYLLPYTTLPFGVSCMIIAERPPGNNSMGEIGNEKNGSE